MVIKLIIKKKKFFRKYDRIQPQHPRGQNFDLRLIILRHAERVDVLLGEKWYEQVFGGAPSAPPQRYQNSILPHGLPQRLNTLLYVFDPPITRSGQQKSYTRGQNLARMGLSVDYCYSSPACRSVLTSTAVLQGMNRSQIPIRLEPFLFEPLNWNTPLQALGNVSPFMSSGDWLQSGFNVDRRYRRINDYLDPFETENDYYLRSDKVFRSIVGRYSANHSPHGHRRPTTVLIVGHAASPIIFETIAQQQPFNAEQFGQQCAHISYLHATVLERNATNGVWSIQRLPAIV